jgi:cardiolipin synthase
MDLAAWEDQLDKLVGSKRFSGTIEVLVDGDQYFPELIDSVLGATKSVKVRTYIFDNDDYATALADMLKGQSEKVEVKVLVDGLGTTMAQGASAGTVPAEYEAPTSITRYIKSGSDVQVRRVANPMTTGDHSKTTIIDSDHAYIGGMNIGREYRWEWHDMMMRVEGSIVSYIEREFDKTWAHRNVMGDFVLAGTTLSNPMPDSVEVDHPIRPLLTLPRRSEIYKAQVEAIRNSQSYIYLQNAYLSDAVIIHELAKARLRGVDVRVIIPMEGNHGVMNLNNVIAANRLMKYGVRVFAYPGMSHIKAAIYDGWACVGSANFDKLSFQVNKEMNLGSSDPAFVRQLIDKVFDPDFAAAVELEDPLPASWKNTFASIVASQL